MKQTTNNTEGTMKITDTKAVKTYFKNDQNRGRTTTLINKRTGEKLGSWMDILTRKDCWFLYQKQLIRGW